MRYKRSWGELPYRLCCFLRFVRDRLRAVCWLEGFGRATRLLDLLRGLCWLGRSGALLGCSTDFGLSVGWKVSGALLGCSTCFGLFVGWEVSGALLGCSTDFGLSDGWEVPSCSSAAVVEDGSGGAEDAEVALFNAVEEVAGTRNLKPENIIELAKKPITQRRK